MSSLLDLQHRLVGSGLKVTHRIALGADVAIARGLLAEAFLKGDADLFFGIDDDIGFNLDIFQRLSTFCSDGGDGVVGALYPQRKANLKQFAQSVRSGLDDATALLNACLPYGYDPTSPKPFFPTTVMGLGFYMATREVFERIDASGHVIGREMVIGGASYVYRGFYDPLVLDDKTYLGEDRAFLHRAAQAGIQPFGYFGPGISHTGMMTFST